METTEPKTMPLSCPLTEQEERIFKLLLEVNERFDAGCVLRVAGGWVRDKVLGNHSDDIDIAIEGGTGAQFSEKIIQYQDEMGQETRSVGLIRINPEQSKHLETATTHIFGTAVDLVNLRSEEYTSSTRIPTVRHGTPLEDARRRDFTINALFYNLHTKMVEDYTSGISDIQNKIIRTPLDPLVTFTDDPLRLLRCVRFSGRFNCEVDTAIKVAARQPGILAALNRKVSRGRIGIEIKKMMSSITPSKAVRLLKEFQLLEVFQNSKVDKKGKVIEGEPVPFTEENINDTITVLEGLETTSVIPMSPELSLSALFAPYVFSLPSSVSLERLLLGTISHGLQLPKKLVEHTQIIIQNSFLMKGIWTARDLDLTSLEQKQQPPKQEGHLPTSQRVSLCTGMHGAVEKNNKEVTNTFWKECLFLSYYLSKGRGACDFSPDGVLASVEKCDFLSSVPLLKPTTPADRIRLELSLKGPAIKEGIDQAFIYQCEYPSASADEIMGYLKRIPMKSSVKPPAKQKNKTQPVKATANIKSQKPPS
eukprot:TRINITY_DN24846_c0_g1_i1.p1 TRINITY_DN24846_c0_g1~~TRINITY_DN24846_c0_g1_i1.p1  ORF type:complete len:535 (+),score=109.45 TRINITY_DN24846_c0_g1_i1:77-1681(+)